MLAEREDGDSEFLSMLVVRIFPAFCVGETNAAEGTAKTKNKDETSFMFLLPIRKRMEEGSVKQR